MVSIYTPLVILNELIIMFKFFSSGFSSAIFGAKFTSTGNVDLSSVSLDGPLFVIATTVFLLALFTFFLNFLLSFADKKPIGADGKPVSFQSARLSSLIYLVLLILLFVGTPVIISFLDNFAGVLCSSFSDKTHAELSQVTIDHFKNNFSNGSTGDLDKLMKSNFDIKILNNNDFIKIKSEIS
jgi:hypothetical protein